MVNVHTTEDMEGFGAGHVPERDDAGLMGGDASVLVVVEERHAFDTRLVRAVHQNLPPLH